MKYNLEVIIDEQEHNSLNYEIKEGKNTVGSFPSCEIVLNYPKIVDGKHVCIEIDEDEISITDLNS